MMIHNTACMILQSMMLIEKASKENVSYNFSHEMT